MIEYKVHIQDIGWTNWYRDGEMAGTSGQSLWLEAIQIKIVDKIKKGKIYVDTVIPNTYYENKEIKNVYSACLVCDSYYKRNYHGRVSYIPEKLNYCPTCGVKLDGGGKWWHRKKQ